MPRRWPRHLATAAVVLTLGALAWAQEGAAQQAPAPPSPTEMLQMPVSPLAPGDVPFPQEVKNPNGGDPAAVKRGMLAFQTMNCIGCHAPNGGGGMGPALSMREFIYGREPANIYLSIRQGRPYGMPAWGALLSADGIWDLVTYITSISSAPEDGWGQTTSLSASLPAIQQIPAELVSTPEPWTQTEPFGNGRKP